MEQTRTESAVDRAPAPERRLRLLFAAYMAGGNATILANMREAIGDRPDVNAAWAPIDLDAESKRYGRRGEAGTRSLLPGTIRNSMVTARHVRELEREGRFDAAWFFQQTICMFLWRFRRRVPYCVAMDGTPLWYARNGLWYAQFKTDFGTLAERLKYRMVRCVYRGAYHLLPLCTGVRDSLVEEYGIPRERITVVPPGVNLRLYAPPDRGSAARRARRPKVLFVGADYERKGGDVVSEVALRPEFREVEFHVVTRSHAGQIPPNVVLHTDMASNSGALVRLYADADVFLLPTRQDAHSVATIEAMAMGLPVITTATGGIVDIVDEGKTGYFVPAGDAAALAGRLRTLLTDTELRLRLGAASRRRVEERFDNDKLACTVVEVLRRAAARA